MRHRKHKITLDRKAGPRRALLRGLITNLFEHGAITTTQAKAKAMRSSTEHLLHGAKKSESARRAAVAFLSTAGAREKFLKTWLPGSAQRNGGYLRIIKLPARRGDGAATARVELVQ